VAQRACSGEVAAAGLAAVHAADWQATEEALASYRSGGLLGEQASDTEVFIFGW
jgi:hypothetical protein